MIKRILVSLCLIIGFGLFIPTVGLAQETTELINPIGGTEENPAGISRLGQNDDASKPIQDLTARIIQNVLGLVGSFALIVFIYGGFTWLTSAGAADKVKAGWKAMIFAAVGLFIIFGAYAILSTVITGLTGA